MDRHWLLYRYVICPALQTILPIMNYRITGNRNSGTDLDYVNYVTLLKSYITLVRLIVTTFTP